MSLASEKVRELKGHRAAINLSGRRWIYQVTEGFQSCRGNGSAAYDEQTGEVIFFYEDASAKVVLATSYEKVNGNSRGLRYAFMTRDGRVLPEPEYCGIINGKEKVVEQHRERLIRGLASFAPL